MGLVSSAIMQRLMSFLSYLWCVLVIGSWFVIFGIGGILLSLTVFPLLRLLPGSVDARRRRGRRLIGFCFGSLMWWLRKLGVMTVEQHHMERLKSAKNVLVLANHPTYLDVVWLVSLLPEADCVVKGALFRNPFFRGIVSAADYIRNSDPETLIADCVNSLNQGRSLIIFPEGTRSVPGQALRFLRGTAHIALQSDCTILPITILCDPPVLTKSAPWYKLPSRPFHFRLEVLPAFPAHDLVRPNLEPSIAARRLTERLEEFFDTEIELHERTGT